MFCFVFAIAWIPLILSVTEFGEVDLLPFSIYNQNSPDGHGCSKLREILNQTSLIINGEQQNLRTHPLISSLSVINGIPENAVLCLIGPTHFFSIIESSALVEFFNNGGSLLLADDFGTGNTLLDNLALIYDDWPTTTLFLTQISEIRFSNRLLLDADSNDGNKPLLPTMTSFTDGGRIFRNTRYVIMNYATTIEGAINGSIVSTSSNSWTVAPAPPPQHPTAYWTDPAYDPDRGDEAGPFTVMAEIGVGNGRIILISDPSIFVDDMIERGDNRIFAQELFTYLAIQAQTSLIVIDHNHLNWTPVSPVLYIGLMLGQITYISANWLLAPLAPILAIWMVRKYLPFGKPEKTKPREIFRVRGQTLFTRTLSEYMTHQKYDEALRILYGRLKRNLMRRHGIRIFDVPRLMVKVSKTRQPSDIALLNSDFESLEKATHESRRISHDQFLELFFKIQRIQENIG